LDIHATDEDVQKYLDGRMSELKVLDKRNKDLTDEIKTRITMESKQKIAEATNGI
jgi:hypothetical protein